MIRAGDKICVGVSAGKDSLTLLVALAELRRFYPKPFTLCAVTVDLGFSGADYSEIEELCRRLAVEYRVVPTEIGKVVFDIRREKNPCSLCAKMRRGAQQRRWAALPSRSGTILTTRRRLSCSTCFTRGASAAFRR